MLAPVPSPRFAIAQVTPYAWEQHHEVNAYVERVADELCGRGHRVVVIAPSDSRELIREGRQTVKRLDRDPEAVFAPEGCAQVITVGQSLPFPPTRRGAAVSLPLDVSRTIEELLERAPFDFVHVHEPFAPSASSAALRHSRALNVGTFHAPTERVLSTQLARRLVELLFGRLDGRTASFDVTGDLLARFFPGDYPVVRPGADVAVAASAGLSPAPQHVMRAVAGGAVPVASRLPVYEEVLAYGERGLLFEPRDTATLASQLERLIADGALRQRLHAGCVDARREFSWSATADALERLYQEIAARRHDPNGRPEVRRRLRSREFVHVDLHMHTDHSPDCATSVDTLLGSAKRAGLGAIAITDHNEVSGALEARERADGVKVIVAEEVKTADQGEVIGLFIEEKIPLGMTLQETIAEIQRQGGLVYVPHPFDRMHAVPDYEHLLDVVGDLDAIEVFNPRVAISSFNEEAARFAAKYRIVAGAGSDSHVPQGLGSVKIRMRDFDGAEEFLESLREADIIRKKTSLF